MASFESVLQIKGKEYNVLYSDFDVHQYTDSLGRPASPTFGGVYTLDIEAPPSGDSTLYEWMVEPGLFLNGQVLIKNLSSRTNLKVIKFYNAYCVDLEQHFDGTGLSGGERSLRLSLRVSPQAVNINGLMHDNDWPAPEPIVDWDWTEMDAACHPERQVKEEPSALSEGLHTLLDVVGMIPIVGEVADAANALIYAAEGDYTNAALSAASMIPLAGNVVGAAKLAKRVVKVADKVSDAVKGPVKKLLKTCGDPVDVASGAVLAESIDFTLPGPIPLTWERTWFSSSTYQGTLGHGWCHAYEWAVVAVADDGSVGVRDGEGRLVAFDAPTPGGKGVQSERLALFVDVTGGYRVWHMDELRWYTFGAIQAGQSFPQPLQAIEDPNGFFIRFDHNPAGHLKAITDSAGRVLPVDTDEQGRVVAIYSPQTDELDAFALVRYEYDQTGNLAVAIDAEEQRMAYHYDGHQLVQRTSRSGVNWYFRYENNVAGARCVRTWGDGDLLSYTLRYDSDTQTTVWDSYQQPTVYTHQNGLVVKQVDALGGEQAWTYSEAGQLHSEKDALGNVTRYEYDEQGRMVTFTLSNGNVINNRYNERGLLVEVTDVRGGRWGWTYDERGNVLERTDPLGVTTRFDYDEQGKLIRVTNALGQRTHLRYDEQHNIAHLVTPDEQIRSRTYDRLGRLSTITDPTGSVQRRRYDRLNQLIEVEEADGLLRRLMYDGSGNVIEARQGDEIVQFSYTGLNQMTNRQQAGQQVQFEYDKEGRLTGLVNEAGLRYRFGLDALGQVIEEEGFDGLLRRYERDAAGRVVKTLRPAGRSTEYNYTTDGQVSQIQYSDGTQEVYGYDAAGSLTKAQNQTTTVSLERDALGRVTQESQDEHWVAYTYNPLGQRTAVRSSLGADISLTHDAMGNVSAMAAGSWRVDFRYDQRGLEVQRQLSGGVRVSWQRDRLGRPTQQLIGEARQRSYQWQASDRLTQIDDTLLGLSQFEHDVFGALTQAAYSDGSQELRLPDAVGNLFETATKTDRQYGPGGQLLQSRQATYQYDEEGNLTQKTTRKGEVWRYEWAGNGLLQQVVRPDGVAVGFAYDGLGRRLSKSYKGKVTHWVWQGDVPLHEWQTLELDGANTNDVITWLFEEDSFAPIGKLQGSTRQSIVTDHLGTPIEMVDQGGLRQWSAQTTSYGRVRLEQGTRIECPFRFQGQYEDTETGLYYNRFRYYDPQEGVYVSQDPIRLGGGTALYNYVSNTNSWVDELGLTGDNLLEWVDPKILNFSQGYVTSQVDDYEKLMREGAWDWNRSPLQVAEVNGKMVSLDNRRLLAAQRAGVTSVPIQKVDLNAIRPDGGTYGSNLKKKLNSRPKHRPDLPKIKLPSEGTPIQPQIICKP